MASTTSEPITMQPSFDRARPLLAVHLRTFLSAVDFKRFVMAVPGVYEHYTRFKHHVMMACEPDGASQPVFTNAVAFHQHHRQQELGSNVNHLQPPSDQQGGGGGSGGGDDVDDDFTMLIEAPPPPLQLLSIDGNGNDVDVGVGVGDGGDAHKRAGWVVAEIEKRCGVVDKARVLQYRMTYAFAACGGGGGAVSQHAVDRALERYVVHSVRCDRLMKKVEYFLWPLVKTYVYRYDVWKSACDALPGAVKYEAMLQHRDGMRRAARAVELDVALKVIGFTDDEVEASKAAFSSALREFCWHFKTYLHLPLLAVVRVLAIIQEYRPSDSETRHAKLKSALMAYGRPIRSDSDLCSAYIAGEKCLEVEEVAAIVVMTARGFELGGRELMHLHNQEIAECSLTEYAYSDGMSWPEAVDRAVSELDPPEREEPVYRKYRKYDDEDEDEYMDGYGYGDYDNYNRW